MLGRSALFVYNRREEKTDEELLAEIQEEIKGTINKEDVVTDEITGILSYYAYVGQIAYEITDGKYETIFSTIMLAIVFLAAVLVGIDTYSLKGSQHILDGFTWFVFSAFALEFVLKLLSEKLKPYRYFIGPEGASNTFDFLIVIFSVPQISSLAGGKATVIRLVTKLFKLARIVKLLRAVPALNIIISGLMSGLKSVGYILLLLFMIIYIYAILGVIFFHSTDPFYFDSILVAMMTLFHVLTFDNWDNNIYINLYGCDAYNSGLYVSQINGNFTDEEWSQIPDMYRCPGPAPINYGGAFYWVTFVVVTGLMLLSLFIGVITISMQSSLEEVKLEDQETSRKKRLVKQMHELEAMQQKQMLLAYEDADLENDVSSVGILLRFLSSKRTISLNEQEKIERMNEMRELLSKAWKGQSLDEKFNFDSILKSKLSIIVREAALQSRQLLDSMAFNYFFVAFLCFTAVMVGYETDTQSKLPGVEEVITSVFTTEIFIRMAAEEFDLVEYIRNPWNVFDVIITVFSAVNFGGGNIAAIARLFRLARVVKLIDLIPQLNVIVNALFRAVGSIYYIFTILILCIYLFAIGGVMFFEKNDPAHFGTLHWAMVILFDIATLDQWGNILYINFYGCDKYPRGGTPECTHPIATKSYALLFFIVYIVVCTFVLLTLFIGVVTTAMEEETEVFKAKQDLDSRLRKVCREKKILPRVLGMYRRVFNILDMDGSGTIEAEELQIGLSSIGIYPTQEELIAWVKEVDDDFNGEFDLHEFVAFMTMLYQRNLKEKFFKTFQTIVKYARKLRAEKFRKKHFGDVAITVLSSVKEKRSVHYSESGLSPVRALSFSQSSSNQEDSSHANTLGVGEVMVLGEVDGEGRGVYVATAAVTDSQAQARAQAQQPQGEYGKALVEVRSDLSGSHIQSIAPQRGYLKLTGATAGHGGFNSKQHSSSLSSSSSFPLKSQPTTSAGAYTAHSATSYATSPAPTPTPAHARKYSLSWLKNFQRIRIVPDNMGTAASGGGSVAASRVTVIDSHPADFFDDLGDNTMDLTPRGPNDSNRSLGSESDVDAIVPHRQQQQQQQQDRLVKLSRDYSMRALYKQQLEALSISPRLKPTTTATSSSALTTDASNRQQRAWLKPFKPSNRAVSYALSDPVGSPSVGEEGGTRSFHWGDSPNQHETHNVVLMDKVEILKQTYLSPSKRAAAARVSSSSSSASRGHSAGQGGADLDQGVYSFHDPTLEQWLSGSVGHGASESTQRQDF